MTTTAAATTPPPAAATRLARPAPGRPVFPDVLRSEWTKLRSVRSTFWTLVLTAVATIGLSALLCAVFVAGYDKLSPAKRAIFDPASYSLNGLFLAQLAIGVLGVLAITSEYSTGMIRASLAAVPQRLHLLAAKSTVFAVVTLAVTTVISFVTFFIGQAIFSTKGLEAHLGEPGSLRIVIGAALYLTVLGLFALGLGAIIRHSAGAIGGLFGTIFVVPSLVSLLPSGDTLAKFLPSNAGQAVFLGANQQHAATLAPWTGFGVFVLWAALALGVAAVLLVRRDA